MSVPSVLETSRRNLLVSCRARIRPDRPAATRRDNHHEQRDVLDGKPVTSVAADLIVRELLGDWVS